MGIQNHLKYSETSAYAVSSSNVNQSVNNIQKLWNNPRTYSRNLKPTICPNCGNTWSPAYRQYCNKRGEACCINNRFAKAFRKPKSAMKPKRGVNNIEEMMSAVATVGTSLSVGEQNQIDNMLKAKYLRRKLRF